MFLIYAHFNIVVGLLIATNHVLIYICKESRLLFLIIIEFVYVSITLNGNCLDVVTICAKELIVCRN